MADKKTPEAPASDAKPLSELMAEAGLEKWQRRALLARRDLLKHTDERSIVSVAEFTTALQRALHGGA